MASGPGPQSPPAGRRLVGLGGMMMTVMIPSRSVDLAVSGLA